MGLRGEVFSWRTTSANDRRTYFFNLKENRTGDLYLTIVESKKHGETDFERHQIQVFEEDFDKFRVGIDKVFDHLKSQGRTARAVRTPDASRKPEASRGKSRPPADRPRRFRKRETSDGE